MKVASSDLSQGACCLPSSSSSADWQFVGLCSNLPACLATSTHKQTHPGCSYVQVMLERIAALEAMVQQAPIVSGRFTAAPFLYLAQPLHQDMSAAVTAAAQLGRYHCSPPCTALQTVIYDLHA